MQESTKFTTSSLWAKGSWERHGSAPESRRRFPRLRRYVQIFKIVFVGIGLLVGCDQPTQPAKPFSSDFVPVLQFDNQESTAEIDLASANADSGSATNDESNQAHHHPSSDNNPAPLARISPDPHQDRDDLHHVPFDSNNPQDSGTEDNSYANGNKVEVSEVRPAFEPPRPEKPGFVAIDFADYNYRELKTLNFQLIRLIQSQSFREKMMALFGDEDILDYQSTSVITGESVDLYMLEGRGGSYGTTLMFVNEDGTVEFTTISILSRFLDRDYQDPEHGPIARLTEEEFFQANQYYRIIAPLYNSGYLAEVAGIDDYYKLNEAITTGGLRWFLELLQAKFLLDNGNGANAYNYVVGNRYFPGLSYMSSAINPPYEELHNFVLDNLDAHFTFEDYFNSDQFRELNDLFRGKYLDWYLSQGYDDQSVQLYNLIAAGRLSSALNPENLPATLPFPPHYP